VPSATTADSSFANAPFEGAKKVVSLPVSRSCFRRLVTSGKAPESSTAWGGEQVRERETSDWIDCEHK